MKLAKHFLLKVGGISFVLVLFALIGAMLGKGF